MTICYRVPSSEFRVPNVVVVVVVVVFIGVVVVVGVVVLLSIIVSRLHQSIWTPLQNSRSERPALLADCTSSIIQQRKQAVHLWHSAGSSYDQPSRQRQPRKKPCTSLRYTRRPKHRARNIDPLILEPLLSR